MVILKTTFGKKKKVESLRRSLGRAIVSFVLVVAGAMGIQARVD